MTSPYRLPWTERPNAHASRKGLQSIGLATLLLLCPLAAPAQAAKSQGNLLQGTELQHTLSADPQAPVEILSDTHGVNFTPYLRHLVQQLQASQQSPNSTHPGVTSDFALIRLTILPDGSIAALHLDGSSQNDAFNRQAWASLTNLGKVAPLPAQFSGPNLTVRLRMASTGNTPS